LLAVPGSQGFVFGQKWRLHAAISASFGLPIQGQTEKQSMFELSRQEIRA
jgi:hypothetical protein